MNPVAPVSKPRRRYRVPLGMPKGRDNWRLGSAVSAVVHLTILLILLSPFGVLGDVFEVPQGAGGPGPAGGGGGGTRGTGSIRAERVNYVPIVQESPAAPVPPKLVPPPPVPVPLTPQVQLQAPKEPQLALITGTGGGTGADGTSGSGPGTGGGIGTGIGTGRGSAVGPGTGGGNQENHPPEAIEVFMPPLPVPGSVKGHRLIAEFDVDERGNVLGVNFNETRDRGYNGRLRAVLRGFRFRPGTRPDGTPIRMKVQVIVDLY